MKLELEVQLRLGGFALDARFHAPGGITALFGASGAGKTLTLRCIAGLNRPDSGRILVGDRLLFDSASGVDLPTRFRRLGYVFQQYLLFPHLDVAGNVAFGLQGSRDENEHRVRDLLAMMGLSGYERRGIRELSGGEQQRIALARALAPRPDMLLLDEPLAALDARARRRLRGELRRIHEVTGVPMVLVTHSQVELRELSDWVVLYDAGVVLRSGPTQEVLQDPGSAEAAELLLDVGV